jgi:flagellar basal-body rod protein FlgB
MGRTMTIADVPLLATLKSKMRWHNQRQGTLAENVANADTPGYKARDLKTPTFEVASANAPQRTDPGHISSFGAKGTDMRAQRASSFETTPRGNSVVLEDEMIRVAQNQMDYQTVSSLYQKGLGLMKIAIGKRG